MPETTLLEVIDTAKRKILSGGAVSISSAGRSVSFLSLSELQKMEQEEQARQRTGIVMSKTRNTPYDRNY